MGSTPLKGGLIAIENCRILEITQDPDETLRWILLEAARKFGTSDSLPVGYQKTLTEDLSRFIPFLPGVGNGANIQPFPLFRLYAFISEEETLALIRGEDAGKIAERSQTTFPHSVRSAERALLDGKAYLERDWGLIGLALPGWVILFSEDVKTTCQDLVEGETRAAFIPAVDEWINQITPEVENGELLSLLLGFFLHSLPNREQ